MPHGTGSEIDNGELIVELTRLAPMPTSHRPMPLSMDSSIEHPVARRRTSGAGRTPIAFGP